MELDYKYMNKTSTVSNFLIILSILYISFLVISNFVGSKIANIGGFDLPSSILFYPLTYIIDAIITEIYGFKISRRVIWLGFLSNFLIVFGCWLSIYIPASDLWKNQLAFESVFSQSTKILVASIFSCLTGEFLNSMILSKLKVITKGKYFKSRLIFSALFAVVIDSSIFCFIAFNNIIPTNVILNIILTQCIFKLSYEIIFLPITSKIVLYIKSKENIDTLDNNVIYNPFSVYK